MFVNPGLKSANPSFDRIVRSTIPGMAHWAGTGPAGKCCGDCRFLEKRGSRGYGCDLFRQRTGKTLEEEIPRKTKSCKYFAARTLSY